MRVRKTGVNDEHRETTVKPAMHFNTTSGSSVLTHNNLPDDATQTSSDSSSNHSTIRTSNDPPGGVTITRSGRMSKPPVSYGLK